MATANYEMDKLYDSVGLLRMKDSYLSGGEASPQDRLASVCNQFGTDDDHRRRLYEYASKHWLSLSSPLLGYNKDKKMSYPISCYLLYLHDTVEGLIDTLSEANHLSVCGGGVSVKMGIRPLNDKSLGVVSHCKTYDSCVLAYKQGSRRGSYAMYLDVSHPEILAFIDIRKPTGDYNMRCLNIHNAICLSDKFMEIIERCTEDPSADDSWDLVDPSTGVVKQTVSAKLIWQKIIEMRMQTGEPYLCFVDACNRDMNPYQKARGMKIEQSNLCTEVIVPTNETRSSLCCLASVNIEKYEEWKNNERFIGDTMEMLDNVLTEFERKATSHRFDRVNDSVKKERNIGIGVLGFHSYLQSVGVSIESEEAQRVNIEIFKWLNETCDKYNLELGSRRGTPEDIAGSGRRFAYTMAVAPTATTSIIMGNTSPSIEPFRANVYRQDTVSGSQFNKNKNLDRLFDSKGYGPKLKAKLWTSIVANDGSVQHLDERFITKSEKDVFKTFIEVEQSKLVELAAGRHKYIDQGQSLTLTFGPDEPVANIHRIHLQAWKSGLKTMYYLRSAKISRADKLNADDPMTQGCKSCEA
ncbi:ribonucleotide reductase [Diadromus pulchellus ascovirus 4a]|uniref:Ribonucleotide reductase large subunit n=1 Tax=Diadromus pulchellus ascovirus 4a TaxID=158683 RepID=F2NYY3_9VIRU|nr:ribonucleotide reductase [Diadromus pulchellus ascovirus 4a]CCA61411.1 unnamed protein product [Diadromus pulchellus ascovirus 4a]